VQLGNRLAGLWTGDNCTNSDAAGAVDEQTSSAVDGNELVKAISQPLDASSNDVALAGAEPIHRTYEPPVRRDWFYDPTQDETIWQLGLAQNFAFENWWRSGGREESLSGDTRSEYEE
jgi:hypothetical protein